MISSLAWIALGSCVGLLSTFFGVGGGVIVVAALVSFGGFGQHEAQATSLAFIAPTAAIGLLALQRRRLGNVRLSLALGVTGAVAAVGGALTALVLPAHLLRYAFAIFIGVVGARMLLHNPGDSEASAHGPTRQELPQRD